jgi:hypothetical protein
MTSDGLGEMFEDDCADMYTGKLTFFSLLAAVTKILVRVVARLLNFARAPK